jgi:hypothetical protein
MAINLQEIINGIKKGASGIGQGVSAAAQVGGEMLETNYQRSRANSAIPIALGEQLRGRQLSPEQEARPIVKEARMKEVGNRMSGLAVPLMSKPVPPEKLFPMNGEFFKRLADSMNRKAGTQIGPEQFAKGFYKYFGRGQISDVELSTLLKERLKSFHPEEIDDIIREIGEIK